MSALREIYIDLVDKRLWPIAIALLAALAAIPFLLKSDPAASPAPVPTAQAAGSASDPALPEAAVSPIATAGHGLFVGVPKDPFTPRAIPLAPSATMTTTATAPGTLPATPLPPSGSGGAGSGTVTTPGSYTPSPGTSSPGTTSPTHTVDRPPAVARETYVVVRFWRAGSKPARHEVAPLSPLPPRSAPFIVYMGQGKDGETAIFSFSADVVPDGDGICRPNKALCQYLHLRPGDTETFSVAGPKGSIDYRLSVTGFVEH